jgi:CRP/FNR family transcriptional regulator
MNGQEPHGQMPGGRQAHAKGRGTETMESRRRLENHRNPISFQEERMATSSSQLAPQKVLEDPLAHLPCSTIVEFRKGQTIYNSDQRSSAIYLVIEGRVKVARLADDGRQVVVDIYQPDEFFGESAFVSLPQRSEQAVALEKTKLMTWTTAEIEDIIAKRPRLAIALLQILVERTLEFSRRIESFSVDNISRRLARSLIRFSDRLGAAEEDGATCMVPFTHELLSQYVGTSREIVTHYMNQFRRLGYVKYSRKGITLYRDALSDWLTQKA